MSENLGGVSQASLIEESVRLGLGKLSADGALVVETGKHTGRAANSRYLVKSGATATSVNWGDTNLGIEEDFAGEFFSKLKERIHKSRFYSTHRFVSGFPVQVTSTSPWHIAFAQNMFRETPVKSVEQRFQDRLQPIQIFHDPTATVSDLGLKFKDQTLILLDLVERKVGIVGTAYAGEIKKSAFTLCNYILPEVGFLPMHASANCDSEGKNSSVLFGLSGTGKTTLSADPDRFLIGDDEIVWSPAGLTNLEGGCYAKLINLSEKDEPEIYKASNRFGSILENVILNETSRKADFFNGSRTENTRGSYPIEFLRQPFHPSKEAEHPKTIVFLTADAFGAMPAVAKLDFWQTQYHFISGYTSKVAGTEIGVTEPKAAFSACFGAPFMSRHPFVYAKLLAQYVKEYGASVWLLNTGWTGGGYGKGNRFPISVSRNILTAIQSGTLSEQEFYRHPVFGFEVPKACPGVDPQFLKIPEGDSVTRLGEKFVENMSKCSQSHNEFDPKIAELGGSRV